MWTTESVREFLDAQPLKPDNIHAVTEESGDEYTEVRLRYWPRDKSAARLALRFAADAMQKDQDYTDVFLEPGRITVQLCTYCCGPD